MRGFLLAATAAGAVLAVVLMAGRPSGRPALADPAFELITRTGAYHRQQHILSTAEERLVAACMSARGHHYPVADQPFTDRTDEERTLGTERRRDQGYGLSPGALGPAPRSAVDQHADSLPEPTRTAYTTALLGPDDQRRAVRLPGGGQADFASQGCVAEARRNLFGDLMTWARVAHVPEAYGNRLARELPRHPFFRAAVEQWRTCMAGRGHPFNGLDEPREHLARRYAAEGPGEALRQQEITLALTDADCAHAAGVHQRGLAAQRELAATSLSTEDQRTLGELTAAWLAAVDRARRVPGG
ncbi:hypothetical protein [Crossiella sp. CA198]|uniref:hypothetical protein n=1 Tax=Crossiella sp. CA198 TaxID=3455607 RepID=UPI003F8D790D